MQRFVPVTERQNRLQADIIGNSAFHAEGTTLKDGAPCGRLRARIVSRAGTLCLTAHLRKKASYPSTVAHAAERALCSDSHCSSAEARSQSHVSSIL